ncbi:ragulator complex protein LAMTOR3 [Acomys russatus]|uniref:ragulator complex protein LAMTOR3 n=1 Tax=Acomys russatus TaxID=60746 RepID=UPI0021E25295|nr:ragulator complex protein LAMTOR3 [Acomys russatus]
MRTSKYIFSVEIAVKPFAPYSVSSSVANDSAPEHALRPGFLSTFALATDQGSKLGLSKNKSIICYYNTYQVVQFNRLPLVVSFIASSNANTGLIVSLEKELAPLFEELIKVVEVS